MNINGASQLVKGFLNQYEPIIKQNYPCLDNVRINCGQIPAGGTKPLGIDPNSPFQIDTTKNPYELYEVCDAIYKMNLTQRECSALIAHELGHVLAKLTGNDSGDEAEEMYADNIAKSIVGKYEIVSAIDKMIGYFKGQFNFGLGDLYKKTIDNLYNRKVNL